MADRRTPKPTGRRVRGYISDLVELSAPRVLWTALVYHQDYRDDAVLLAGAERIAPFLENSTVPGVPPLMLSAPGVFAFDTGEVRSTRELIGAARGGVGWRAATEWFISAATLLAAALEASSLKSHGSLDPHRILVDYDGTLRLIGLGLPRLDLVDFLDDASLLPPTESLRFTAPESLEGADEDFGTDLFVLGLIAARLGGHALYAGDDPKVLLAAAADGEGHAALKRAEPNCPALPWLGPILEPWPEDRPKSIAEAIAGAKTVLADLTGHTLAEAMDAHAETASDVEVDLPRGWVLPVPPPPLDESHREQATRKLKRSHGEAERALERTLERLPSLEARDWSLSSTAAEAFAEANRHVKAASEAVGVAADALERAGGAGTHPVLDTALAEGEDACDRARGANAEALRAVERATSELEVAEVAAADQLKSSRAKAASALSKETESLAAGLDAIDERTAESVTDAARTLAHDVLKDLRTYAEDAADPAALETLRTRVDELRSAIAIAAQTADAQVAAAEQAAAAEVHRRHVAKVAALDSRIADLVEHAASWDGLLARAESVGGDLSPVRATNSELRAALAAVEERRGQPETDETEAALVAYTETIRGGTGALEAHLATLSATKEAADVDAAERTRVRAAMVDARDEALSLARAAREAERGLTLAHAHAAPVTEALDTLRSALADAERAAEGLKTLELEPEDVPEQVLDAARTHLEFARNAAKQVEASVLETRRLDEAETARLGAEEADRVRALVTLREQLATTGVRVRRAATEVRNALDEAEAPCRPLLSSLATRSSVHLGPLERALDALRQHQALLLGRQTNWEQMAEPADSLDDPDSLEALVHTGDAEASFAEADLADLPDLIDAFSAILAIATAEQQVHDDRLEEARARLEAARKDADAAEAKIPPRHTIPAALREDDALQALEDALLRTAESARGALATARTRLLPDLEQVPEDSWLDDVEGLTAVAVERVDSWVHAHSELVVAIQERTSELERIRRERETAREQATAALEALRSDREKAAVQVPTVDDEAVVERTEATSHALGEALASLVPLPEVDLDADPLAARDLLQPLVGPSASAVVAILQAHRLHVAAVAKATELVDALRTSTARGEVAADQAATASAEARGLLQGLMGTWPHLEADQQALSAAVAEVDQYASTASAQADAASDAESADAGFAAAAAAEAAAEAASAALHAARPLYEALSAAVEEARTRAAAADEQRRLELIEEARSITTVFAGLREQLDTAGQDAVTALEDSPSTAARAAWEQADVALDRANARLSTLDETLQAVFSASTAVEAEAQLDTCRAGVEAAPALIEAAVLAATTATTTARREADANEELVVDLRGSRIELDGIATEVQNAIDELERRARDLDPRPEALDDGLASMATHASHVSGAQDQLGESLEAASAAPDDAAREVLRTQAREAVARATAALNTTRALCTRIEQSFAEAEAAEGRRRTTALETLNTQHAELQTRLTALEETTTRVLAAPDADDVADALGAVERALSAVQEVVSGSEVRLAEANEDVPSRMLEHLVRQGERSQARMIERTAALEATIAGVDAARTEIRNRRQAAHNAFVERMGTLHSDVQTRLEEARDIVRDGRSSLESARPLLGNSPAAAASKAWNTALEAVEASEGALAKADALQAGWPEVPSDTNDDAQRQSLHEEALTQAEALRSAASEAIAEAGAVSGLIDMGLRSAEALAGILEDAGAVRGRYQTFERQLTDRRTTLTEGMEHAPRTAASRHNREAAIQLEEIEETLAEARASLEELGEATSAEQAEALLEVASVSLDIAESVLEYALPAVDRAIQLAHAEAEERRERLERQEAARAALEVALAPERSPSDTEEAIEQCMMDAAVLEHHESIRTAVSSLSSAVVTYSLAHDTFEYDVPDDPNAEPDVLEALLAEVTTARTALDCAGDELDTALAAARVAITEATAADAARAAAIATQRTRFDTAVEALETLQQARAAAHADALAAAEGFPDVGPLEREALEQAAAALQELVVEPTLQDEPTAWSRAADAAETVLATARAIDLDGPIQQLAETVEEARKEAAARQAALDALRTRLHGQLTRLEGLRERAVSALAKARKTAADYPLEAGLPLAALEASHEAIHAVQLDDQLDGDPGTAAQQVERATALVDQLTDHDLDALLAEVELAVTEAIAQEEQAASELARAHATLDDADQLLGRAQTELQTVFDRLARAAAVPEVAGTWRPFSAAYETVTALTIPRERETQLAAARKAASRAEKILEQARSWRELVDPLEKDLADAELAREAARDRLQAACKLSADRVASARDQLPDPTTLPDTELVQAAHNALLQVLDTLDELQVDATVPDDADRALLEAHAELAEAAEAKAAARDLAGLFAELDGAIDAALAAEAAEEAQRVETIRQARATIKTAVEALTEGIDSRGATLADMKAESADPLGRRSEARNALELARGILVDLRSARDTLSDLVSASEAISIAFDAEMQQAAALEHLFTVDTVLDSLVEDGRLLEETVARADSDMEVLNRQLDSVQAILDDVPEPIGPEAADLSEKIDNQALDLAAMRATAELTLEAVKEATDGRTAAAAAERLRSLIREIRQRGEDARSGSDALRTANQRHAERESSAKLEALAATAERATLAAERAARALEDLGAPLAMLSRHADDHPSNERIQTALTELATVNETVLALVDTARRHAEEAKTARDPARAAAAAAESADEAEAAVATVVQRLTTIESHLAEAEEQERAERAAREQAILAARDARLPELRAEVDKLTRRLERFQPPDTSEDVELEAANDVVNTALAATQEANRTAQEAVQLLESARADDVEDFQKDAERAIEASRTVALSLKKAVTALYAEQEAARGRGESLALEEARGRAWEACQLVKSLSTDLTRARASLPELPNPPSPRLREALDRLAEVERRLWRAGQRADEARERAGKTESLAEALSAAESAEKSVGSGSRWEREIDRALSALTRLLNVDEEPAAAAPKSERIKNLRRGRLAAGPPAATPAPAPARDADTTSRAEALLARLRSGKKRGETGRERLQRLRSSPVLESDSAPLPKPPSSPTTGTPAPPRAATGKPAPPREARIQSVPALDPVALPDTNSDYPSLQEFEDYQATTIGPPPAMILEEPPSQTARREPDPAEATVVEAPAELPGRRRSPNLARPRPRGRSKAGDDPDFEDAKTQAFNREMIEAMLKDSGPGWGEDEGSTRWDTADSKPSDPSDD